jgi:hypothetical protein
MCAIETSLTDMISKPLVHKSAFLIEMNDTRCTLVVRRIWRVDIVGTFLCVTFRNENVAAPSYSDVQWLPEQVLVFAFDPITTMAAFANGHQQLPLRTHFHHHGAIGGRDPEISLRICRHAMSLIEMPKHVIADSQNYFVIFIELKQRWPADRAALIGPEIAVEIEGYAEHAIAPIRELEGICEFISHGLPPFDALQKGTIAAVATGTADGGTRTGRDAQRAGLGARGEGFSARTRKFFTLL